MPCSPARLEANRLNALRSTGPRTDEGKEASRRNALKHGLTGAGVVLPKEDEAAIEARFAAYEQELGAEGQVGRDLARRAALMMVRLNRAAEHEAAMLARKIRVAEVAYDEEKSSFVYELADDLNTAPATVVRRLKRTPEGIDWLVKAWQAVKADLLHPTRDLWNGGYWTRIENLMGRRPGEFDKPAVYALSQACWGDIGALGPDQAGDLPPVERKEWARAALAAWIDDRIAELEALRPTLDHDRFAADRADAGRRALFDPGPQAILARKYEAAAERGFYRALRELKDLKQPEAQARAAESEAATVGPAGPLGSFFPEPDPGEPPTPQPDPGRDAAPSATSARQTEAIRPIDGTPAASGRPSTMALPEIPTPERETGRPGDREARREHRLGRRPTGPDADPRSSPGGIRPR